MSFFKNFYIILTILFIVGICPVYPNKRKKQFYCTFWTQLYSITYLLCISGIFLFSAYNWIITDKFLTHCRAICLVSEIVQMLGVTLLIIGILCVGKINGKKLAKLYNDIEKIDEKFKLNVNDKKMFFEHFYIELIIMLLVLFSLHIFFSHWLGLNRTIYATIFYSMASWFLTIENLTSFHIRMVTKLVLKRIIACVGTLDANGFDIIEKLNLNLEIYGWKDVLNDCFGVQLFLLEVLNFLAITLGLFNTIYIAVYVFGYWDSILNFTSCIYILPALLKNVSMNILSEQYGEQVFYFSI